MTGSRSLGNLGVVKEAVDITFGWFGHQIRVNPGAGELEMVDFLDMAKDVELPEDINDMAGATEAITTVKDFLRRQIHPDDWALFWDVAKTNRQELTDLLKVAMTIVTEVAGFPSTPLSDSPDGQRPTQPNSKAGLSSLVTTRALGLLSGRPDLQQAVLRASEGVG